MSDRALQLLRIIMENADVYEQPWDDGTRSRQDKRDHHSIVLARYMADAQRNAEGMVKCRSM